MTKASPKLTFTKITAMTSTIKITIITIIKQNQSHNLKAIFKPVLTGLVVRTN